MNAIAPAEPERRWRIRWANDDERPFIMHAWVEGYKLSPLMRRKTWGDYKRIHAPVLDECYDRDDTAAFVATDEHDRAVGYMLAARWPSIDIVHWIYVVMEHRGHGIAESLIGGLRRNVVYTHRAERNRDLALAAKLRERGYQVSHIPYAEWK